MKILNPVSNEPLCGLHLSDVAHKLLKQHYSYILIYFAAFAAATSLECYSCTSDVDKSCFSSPSTTVSCATSHGKGCATRISPNGIIERGCSDIGLLPEGCQVSQFFGTECVCHIDR